MSLNKEAQLIDDVLKGLSLKNCIAVTFAPVRYISQKEIPCFKDVRKTAFEKIKPSLDEYIRQVELQKQGGAR